MYYKCVQYIFEDGYLATSYDDNMYLNDIERISKEFYDIALESDYEYRGFIVVKGGK